MEVNTHMNAVSGLVETRIFRSSGQTAFLPAKPTGQLLSILKQIPPDMFDMILRPYAEHLPVIPEFFAHTRKD